METIDPKDSVHAEQFGQDAVAAESTSDSSAIGQEKAVTTPVGHDETLEVVEHAHHDEDTDDDENIDPANLEEILEIDEVEKPAEEYSRFTKAELVNKLEALLSTKSVEKVRTSVDSIKINFYKKNKADLERLRKDAEDSGEEAVFISQADPLEDRLKELLKKYRDQKAEFIQKTEADKQKNLLDKYKVIDEIKDLVNRKEAINETFHQFRELQNRWRSIGAVPQANIKDLWDRYHHYVEIFYDFIKINKDLRDLDLKRNYEVKLELCEKAEELLLDTSIIKAARALQKMHEQWREVGPVPAEVKDNIWDRFKAVTTSINKKHQDYFDNIKDTQKKNLETKIILSERAEQISKIQINSLKEWETYYSEVVDLQQIWRTVGYAPKKDNNRIYNRFKAGCDIFFMRKRESYAQNREEQNANLQLKIDICEKAEQLKDSTDWKNTSEELIALQLQWKTIGIIPRKSADQIWRRFRHACDHFFTRKSEHYNSMDSQYDGNLLQKLALIDEITAFVPGENVDDNFEKLKDFQHRWGEIGFVPLKSKDEVQKKYREAINRHFDSLKVDEPQRNMMKFKNKIENFSSKNKDDRKVGLERDKIIHKLRQIESDIVVWENNIGFFAKSKNADVMRAEVQRKIEEARAEIKALEEKIRLIDNIDTE